MLIEVCSGTWPPRIRSPPHSSESMRESQEGSEKFLPLQGRRQPTDASFRLLVDSVKDYAIYMLDPCGIVTTWNTGAELIKGYRAAEIIGQHFSVFYPPDAVESGWPEHELETAKRTGRFEDEGWRLRKDGSRFWANVVITALRDPAGNLIGFAKVTRDLSERRRQEESLRQSEERVRLLVQEVEDYAIFMLDADGRITSWNAGAQRIKGYRADEVLGRHFSLFYPPEDRDRHKPEQQLRWARERGRVEDEGWKIRKDGTRFWANVVVTALHNKEGQLVGFAKITRDLTERRRVEVLEQSSRQMHEFLAMLAHELRNPLAPIQNATSVMRMRTLNDATLEWSRDVVERQVGHLSRLVDDLLDVSRITTGKIALRKEQVDLGLVVNRAVEASRPMIDKRQQTLDIVVPEEPVTVEGDPVRLVQVVVNLLNNAAKFTPAVGQIRLSVARENDQAVIRCRDSGIGMSRELLARVFDLFAQGCRGEDRSEGGLGIGLTLSRRVVEMHGGTIQATSEGAGRGSEMIVRLPLAASAVEEDPEPAEHGRVPQQNPRRVLVVDDNRDAAESLAMLLKLKGHDVRTAHDGPSALDSAAQYHPDVVLLDIGLPGMSGYQVAQLIRGLPGLRNVMLVAVTGYGQDEDRRRAHEAGMDRHLVKPVAPAAVEEVLASQPSGESN